MARVVCKLPNASEIISGVNFAIHEMGMLSEEISDDVADFFKSIPGYFHFQSIENDLEPLYKQATDLGIAVDKRWKESRVKAEIQSKLDEIEKAAKEIVAPIDNTLVK